MIILNLIIFRKYNIAYTLTVINTIMYFNLVREYNDLSFILNFIPIIIIIISLLE